MSSDSQILVITVSNWCHHGITAVLLHPQCRLTKKTTTVPVRDNIESSGNQCVNYDYRNKQWSQHISYLMSVEHFAGTRAKRFFTRKGFK